MYVFMYACVYDFLRVYMDGWMCVCVCVCVFIDACVYDFCVGVYGWFDVCVYLFV